MTQEVAHSSNHRRLVHDASSELHGISPTDPATYVAVAVVMSLVRDRLVLTEIPACDRLLPDMNRASMWVVAVVLSSSMMAARQAPFQRPQVTDVYVSGEAGYHTFRIPSVIATPKGTLLAFAEARRMGASDAGDIDLVVKRSHDGGQSWSPLQVIGDNGANTFGNPCPVVDRKTGALWLLSTHNRGTDREKDIIAGRSLASRTVWAMKTIDDGVTWSTPSRSRRASSSLIGRGTRLARVSAFRPAAAVSSFPPTTPRQKAECTDPTSSTATMGASIGIWEPAPTRARTRVRSSSWPTAG